MAEFIVNPRRSHRVPARCRTAVLTATASFEAETEDIGARGCQVVSPTGVRKGDAVRLAIRDDKLPDPLRVGGRIAWVSAQLPWRVGIAFDESAVPEATAWCERLLEAYPGMRTLERVPERISLDAMVYLGPPPRFLVDFSADEAALLRAIGSGAPLHELMARFRLRAAAIEPALFSLIARSAVTFVRGQAAHPQSWTRILAELEASFAVESLGTGPGSLAAPPEPRAATAVPAAAPVGAAGPAPNPVPWAAPSGSAPAIPAAPVQPRSRPGAPIPGSFPPPVSPRFGTPPQDPSPQLVLHDSGPPLEVADADPRGAGRRVETGAAWGSPASAAAGKPPRVRSAEAQAAFDRARGEFRAGNVGAAVELLRRALALAPGDAEISDVLGRIALGARDPGAR